MTHVGCGLAVLGAVTVPRTEASRSAGPLSAVVGPDSAGEPTLTKSLAGNPQPMAGRIARDGTAARNVASLSPADRPAPSYAHMFKRTVDRLVAVMRGAPET